MRKFLVGAVVLIGVPNATLAQTNCGRPQSCAVPCTQSCTQTCPPTPSVQPPLPAGAAGEAGAFAAPPRTGTAVGESRSLGVEGFGLHIPAMTLRMPTLQLPGFVRYRREPRMLIDAAEAGYVRNTATEFTYPAGNDSGQIASGAGVAGSSTRGAGSCSNMTPGGAAGGCTNGQGAANAVQPTDIDAVYGADGQIPPPPRIERAVERSIMHPDLGDARRRTNSVSQQAEEQIVQDPATGKFYRVVMHEVAQPQPTSSPRERDLAQALEEQQRRAEQLQDQLSRLETLVERLADNKTSAQPSEVRSDAVVPFPPVGQTSSDAQAGDLFAPPSVPQASAFSNQIGYALEPATRHEALTASYVDPPEAAGSSDADRLMTTNRRSFEHQVVPQPVGQLRPTGEMQLGGTLRRWFTYRAEE